MEKCLAHLLVELMVMQKVLLKECCLVQLMEKHLELPMARLKAMSLVCLSAERTAKQKVTMLDCPMVMSLVCSLAESMAMRKDLQMAHMRP